MFLIRDCKDENLFEKLIARVTNRRKSREFIVVIERDEDGWYVGSVPELHGCHTQARSLDELSKRIKEAILLCLEVAGERAAEPNVC